MHIQSLKTKFWQHLFNNSSVYHWILCGLCQLQAYIWLKWRHMSVVAPQNNGQLNVHKNIPISDKETSSLRLLAICEGNLPLTDRFPWHKASNTESSWCYCVIMAHTFA